MLTVSGMVPETLEQPSTMTPKAFISYSWSTSEHEKWVIQFAEELTSQGVIIVIDKWDLQKGGDSNAFMESMVTDDTITKVIMVCDKVYADKSNKRTGGAGTEAQIITPALYGQTDQNKFVAVIREKDENGKPYLPVYYKGRIYIDLVDEGRYAEEFEQLVRWIYDKPLYTRPALGQKPAYLNDDANTTKLATTVNFKRAIDAIKNSRPTVDANLEEYFSTVIAEMEKLRLNGGNDPNFDEEFIQSIESFIPTRNEIIELFIVMARYNASTASFDKIHQFFEKLAQFHHRPKHINQWSEWNFDNFKFLSEELFLYFVAVMISQDKFQYAAQVVYKPYYMGNLPDYRREPMASFSEFNNYLKILEYRKSHRNLNRISLHADLIHDRCAATGVDFRFILTADFVLYLIGFRLGVRWYPRTLMYAAFSHMTFETFARAASITYFNKLKVLLGVKDKDELVNIMLKIHSDDNRIPSYDYNTISPKDMARLDDIATLP